MTLRHAAGPLMLLAALASPPAHALMAGAAPDTPAARRLDAEGQRRWSGVGRLLTPNGRFGGVAVGATQVLTAAHVAAAFVDAPGRLRFEPADGTAIAAERIDLMPGYHMPANDLALVILVRPLPATVTRYRLLERPLAAGDILDFVGPGASGHGNRGVQPGAAPGALRHGRNVADLVGEYMPGIPIAGHFYGYDFDGPAGTGPLGGTSLGNAVETLVAGGDSGSPVFVRGATGEPRLVGINTVVISAAPGKHPAFRFGDMGAGTDLTATAVRAWLAHASDGTLGGSTTEAPGGHPAWALPAVFGLALVAAAGALSRRR